MITGVNVMDIDQYGKGGLAQVIGGGLNQNNVTIRFTSKPGEAMLFRIVVNGYCVKTYTADQGFAWAEPVRSNSSYHYNASSHSNNIGINSNNNAMNALNHPKPAATGSVIKSWWHFW